MFEDYAGKIRGKIRESGGFLHIRPNAGIALRHSDTQAFTISNYDSF